MNLRWRFAAKCISIISVYGVVSAASSNAQVPGPAREYPHPVVEVKSALQALGAYSEGRLPLLEGFVRSDSAELARYERPYYRFQIQLTSTTVSSTSLRVKATISAWYNDPDVSRSAYRTLVSNDRLETDLFDRLDSYLKQKSFGLSSDLSILERQIAEIRSQRTAVEQQMQQLRLQIEDDSDPSQATKSRYRLAVVKDPRADVTTRPSHTASVLFSARAGDEFEIVEERRNWLLVRLEENSKGWVRRSQLDMLTELSAFSAPATNDAMPEFMISRENVSRFSGTLTGLKGREALFVWVRPVGRIPDAAVAQKKLSYAKQIFAERYYQKGVSQEGVAGVVIIFLDSAGGVAAAKLTDIGRWVEGQLSEALFIRRCSLDPLRSFAR